MLNIQAFYFMSIIKNDLAVGKCACEKYASFMKFHNIRWNIAPVPLHIKSNVIKAKCSPSSPGKAQNIWHARPAGDFLNCHLFNCCHRSQCHHYLVITLILPTCFLKALHPQDTKLRIHTNDKEKTPRYWTNWGNNVIMQLSVKLGPIMIMKIIMIMVMIIIMMMIKIIRLQSSWVHSRSENRQLLNVSPLEVGVGFNK